MALSIFEVCKAIKKEENVLLDRFGKEFIILYPSAVARIISKTINRTSKVAAGSAKVLYEVWCVLALMNLTRPQRVIDPINFSENSGFWLKRRFRKYGVHWTRPNGTSVRDQIPVNVIWESEDSKVYSLAFQPSIGLTSLTPEQVAWFKSIVQGKVWNLGRYLSQSDVNLRPDIFLYKRHVENVVDFRKKHLPEIDVIVNVETKLGWTKDRALVKKLEEYTEAFKPRDGAFVVSLHKELPNLEDKFKVIPAGLDRNKLKPIIQ